MRKTFTIALLLFGFVMGIPLCSTGCASKKETHIYHEDADHHHHHDHDRAKVKVEVDEDD
jgi:hypothetical protein